MNLRISRCSLKLPVMLFVFLNPNEFFNRCPQGYILTIPASAFLRNVGESSTAFPERRSIPFCNQFLPFASNVTSAAIQDRTVIRLDFPRIIHPRQIFAGRFSTRKPTLSPGSALSRFSWCIWIDFTSEVNLPQKWKHYSKAWLAQPTQIMRLSRFVLPTMAVWAIYRRYCLQKIQLFTKVHYFFVHFVDADDQLFNSKGVCK